MHEFTVKLAFSIAITAASVVLGAPLWLAVAMSLVIMSAFEYHLHWNSVLFAPALANVASYVWAGTTMRLLWIRSGTKYAAVVIPIFRMASAWVAQSVTTCVQEGCALSTHTNVTVPTFAEFFVKALFPQATTPVLIASGAARGVSQCDWNNAWACPGKVLTGIVRVCLFGQTVSSSSVQYSLVNLGSDMSVRLPWIALKVEQEADLLWRSFTSDAQHQVIGAPASSQLSGECLALPFHDDLTLASEELFCRAR